MLAPHLPIDTPGSPLNGIAAFACAFVIVLILAGLAGACGVSAGRQDARCARSTGCSARCSACCAALLVLLAVAIVVSYTPAAASTAWRESQGAVWLHAILRELVPLVAPDAIAAARRRSV